MKNKKAVEIFLYILIVVIVLAIIYFSYTLFIQDNLTNNDNGDKFDSDNNPNTDIYHTYTAIFIKNGADKIEKSKITCVLIGDKCEITFPNIIKEDGVVLGWNTENTNYARYKVGDTISLSDNHIFYAITYIENTLTIYDDDIDYIAEKRVSCKAYNDNEGCMVNVPNYNKIGYENRGYSLRSDSLTGTVFPNMNYVIKKDVSLYPVYNTLTRGRVINTSKIVQKYGITIEIEDGCSSNIYNEYLSYLDKINEEASYLLVGSKITLLNEKTFDKLWGEKYMGMNYGPNPLRLFDIKCPSVLNSDYYATMVHELAHTWDFYYSNHFSKNISDENDYINLFSKYQNMTNRPFRNYSYTNIKEFFADTIRYYYFKYLDPRGAYVNLDYPEDVKKVVEKYMCVAKNNYQRGNC